MPNTFDLTLKPVATLEMSRGKLTLEDELRCQICEIGRSMYRSGLVVAREGNLSARLDQDRILVTPAGVCKGELGPPDLLVTDLSGKVSCGTGRPSSEILMHLLFYRLRPDVKAVCHAHPPTATGFAAAGRGFYEPVLPEVIMDLGSIPLAPYGTPGTQDLCKSLEPLVAKHDAILLENHGVVTCGQDLSTAFQRLETVEQLARILFTAHFLGGPNTLSNVNLERLIAAKPVDGLPGPEDPTARCLSAEPFEGKHITERTESRSEETLSKVVARESRSISI